MLAIGFQRLPNGAGLISARKAFDAVQPVQVFFLGHELNGTGASRCQCRFTVFRLSAHAPKVAWKLISVNMKIAVDVIMMTHYITPISGKR